GAGGAGRLAAWLTCLFLVVPASRAAARPTKEEPQSERVAALRAAASKELANSHWKEACALYDQLLVLAPNDAEAKRDAGRAGMAAGDLEYAARVLEQAHHGGGHHRDPELHYLRGEALYALDRTEDA